ncbi:MAG: hypothetical protein ABSE70_11910 [Candidatus Limnocylindrales bacterium]
MIDDRIPSEWPQVVLDAVRQFRQGDVVEEPPFFYFRSDEHALWNLQFEPDDEARDGSIAELDPADGPPYGLITTQTCDLFEEGTRPRQPWFAVAPVYDITSKVTGGQREQIRRGEVGHLILLTADWLGEGTWVADLRIEVPVEKGWLVGREPRKGFASLPESKTLAARLATRRGRPALSAALTARIVLPLRTWLKDKGRRYRDEVASLRLLTADDPAVSLVGGLIVVVAGDGLTDDAKDAWKAFEDGLIDAAAEHGVTALPFRYGTYDDFTGRDIVASVQLDFDYLSPTD